MKFPDKKIVHKLKSENILIYNIRRTLPRKIYSDTFENLILPNLSSEEEKFIQRYYSTESFIYLLEKKPNEKPYYILHSLPHKIDINFGRKILDILKIDKKDQKIFLKYFYRDKERKYFLLKDNITESEELEILKILKKFRNWYISDSNKTKISGIFEKINFPGKKDVFFANMYIDLNHTFFFEHPNEHVPALMIIEAARQFLISCCHVYFKVPLKGVNFILSGMQSKFYSYLELNFPIKLMAKVNKIKYRKGYLNHLNLDVNFYQNNKLSSSFNFTGSVIEKDVFKKLRDDKVNPNDKARFQPRSIFYYNIALRDKNKKKYLCELLDISEEGFKVKSDNSKIEHNISINDFFEFFIFFQEIGFIHGECELRWTYKKEDFIVYGFKIFGMQDVDKDSLKEVIKKFCYAVESRDFY